MSAGEDGIMSIQRFLTCLVFAVSLAGCGGSADSASEDTSVATDTAAGDVTTDIARPESRTYTYRAIGGVSMGATAFSLHTRAVGTWDFVAALGGYIHPIYRQSMMKQHLFGSGCGLETLIAHLDELDDPDSAALDCGLRPTISPWEFPMDHNHWKADDSGGTWDRDHYLTATQGLFMSLGNFLSYNPDHPLLPPGVPVSWAAPGDVAERCDNPVTIGPPWNYNLEYNPEGLYDLVTFCDGTTPLPGGSDHPDFFEIGGNYDPTMDHDIPVLIVVAVDLNGNGRRDYHEPVVSRNNMERFQDTGTDGCWNEDEDGQGGCTGGGDGADPNRDDFAVPGNPLAAEGDGWRQEGEAFADDGLDGVAGTGDYGEGDGAYSVNPNLVSALAETPWDWVATASQADLLAADYFLDGGVRDALGAAVGLYSYAAALEARGVDVGFFDNYSGSPGAILPSDGPADYISNVGDLDLQPEIIGRSYMVSYGDLDATPDEIAMGDGKHIGTGDQMANRLAAFILSALFRWPGLEAEPCLGDMGTTQVSTFYSPANGTRFNFAWSTPPCYDAAGNEDRRYPMIMLLGGHGSAPSEGMASALIFNLMVMNGAAPGFVMAIPDTACCYRDAATGDRYCACTENDADGALLDCVEPACQDAHEDCPVLQFPETALVQECFRGHFYGNLKSDRWGDVDAAQGMRYEDMIFDLQDHMEASFRLLEPVETTRSDGSL